MTVQIMLLTISLGQVVVVIQDVSVAIHAARVTSETLQPFLVAEVQDVEVEVKVRIVIVIVILVVADVVGN